MQNEATSATLPSSGNGTPIRPAPANPLVLVVEDSAPFRESLAIRLRTMGFQTLSAANGDEALRLLDMYQPALILLDLHMPVKDGFAFLDARRRKGDGVECPVMVLTAHHQRRDVTMAASRGIRHYVLKSRENLATLKGKIEQVLQSAAAERSVAEAQRVHAAAKRDAEKDVSTANATALPSDDAGAPAATERDPSNADSGAPASRCEYLLLTEARQQLREMVPLCDEAEALRQVAEAAPAALSASIVEVMHAAESPHATAATIAKQLQKDPGLTAQVLRAANSSVYARRSATTDLTEAVVRLGVRGVVDLAMAIRLMDCFSDGMIGPNVPITGFWKHSLACGAIATTLARTAGLENPEEHFVCGLLHDVGRAVLATQMPAVYAQVLAAAAKLALPVHEVETQLLGVTHAQLIRALGKEWNLPAPMIAPIAVHHLPASELLALPMPNRISAVVLALADRLCHCWCIGVSGNEMVEEISELAAAAGLSPDALASVKSAALSQVRGLETALRRPADRTRPEPAGRIGPNVAWQAVATGEDVNTAAALAANGTARGQVALVASVLAQDDVTNALQACAAHDEMSGKPLPLVLLMDRPVELRDELLRSRRVIAAELPVSLQRLHDALTTPAQSAAA